MDISVIKAVFFELSSALPGLKLAELSEGESGEVLLIFKGDGKRHSLLMHPRPPSPRLYLVKTRQNTRRELTPFAQSLRNNIIGSYCESITQEGLERAVFFQFSRKTRGSIEKTVLVMEMTGKKPNLILLDDASKIILAQSFVPLSGSSQRPLLPGLSYRPPPSPDKISPYEINLDEIKRILADDIQPEKALFRHIGGISPLLAGEAVARADTRTGAQKGAGTSECTDAGAMLGSLKSLLDDVEGKKSAPCIYDLPKRPVLAAFRLTRYEDFPHRDFQSMNEAAEVFHSEEAARLAAAELKGALLKKARAILLAARKKADSIEGDIGKAECADRYQLFGQTLMAWLADVPKGADSVKLKDLETGEPLDIDMDPRLSPVKNAAVYFKKAKKARAGLAILRERLSQSAQEIGKLEVDLAGIETAKTLDELKAYQAPTQKRTATKHYKKPKDELPDFPTFTSVDGYEVMLAKNARMNDILTFKVAQPMDLWFHVQGYHGAHVIVRNPGRRPDIPLNTILEAARAAASYSGAKKDSAVAVDYTFKKYVRKPKHPAPGQAMFTNSKTVFVEPKKPKG
ncbi:MAG: NFACT family protein [Nitrospirota bacterium]